MFFSSHKITNNTNAIWLWQIRIRRNIFIAYCRTLVAKINFMEIKLPEDVQIPNGSFGILFKINITIVLIVVAMLVFAVINDNEYSYYTLLRWVVTIFSILSALNYYSYKKYILFIFFVATAILFNPFFKIALDKQIWDIIDLTYAVVLITILAEFLLRANGKRKKNIEIEMWLKGVLKEIATGKWGYHLAMEELKLDQKLDKDQKDTIKDILKKKYMLLSDNEKKIDYEQYQLAITLRHADEQFRKWEQ